MKGRGRRWVHEQVRLIKTSVRETEKSRDEKRKVEEDG